MRRNPGEQALDALSDDVSEILDTAVTVDQYMVDTFAAQDDGRYAMENVFTYDQGIVEDSRFAYNAVGDRYVDAVLGEMPSVEAVDREMAAGYLAGIGVAIGSACTPGDAADRMLAEDERRIAILAAHAAETVTVFAVEYEYSPITGFADTMRQMLGRDLPEREVFGLTYSTADDELNEVEAVLDAGIRTGFTTPEL